MDARMSCHLSTNELPLGPHGRDDHPSLSWTSTQGLRGELGTCEERQMARAMLPRFVVFDVSLPAKVSIQSGTGPHFRGETVSESPQASVDHICFGCRDCVALAKSKRGGTGRGEVRRDFGGPMKSVLLKRCTSARLVIVTFDRQHENPFIISTLTRRNNPRRHAASVGVWSARQRDQRV